MELSLGFLKAESGSELGFHFILQYSSKELGKDLS